MEAPSEMETDPRLKSMLINIRVEMGRQLKKETNLPGPGIKTEMSIVTGLLFNSKRIMNWNGLFQEVRFVLML